MNKIEVVILYSPINYKQSVQQIIIFKEELIKLRTHHNDLTIIFLLIFSI
jgi:hypothetical protein